MLISEQQGSANSFANNTQCLAENSEPQQVIAFEHQSKIKSAKTLLSTACSGALTKSQTINQFINNCEANSSRKQRDISNSYFQGGIIEVDVTQL